MTGLFDQQSGVQTSFVDCFDAIDASSNEGETTDTCAEKNSLPRRAGDVSNDVGFSDNPASIENGELQVKPIDSALLNDKSIGARLKVERLKRALTLETVAKELCIRATYLTAIEANKFDELPTGIFAVGFLRSYSEFLELDSKGITSEFRSIMGLNKPDIPVCPKAFQLKAGVPLTPENRGRGLVSAFIGVLGVLAVFALISLLEMPGLPKGYMASLDRAAGNIIRTGNASGAANASPLAEVASESDTSLIPAVSAQSTAQPSLLSNDGGQINFDLTQASASLTGDAEIKAIRDVWIGVASLDGAVLWQGVLPAGGVYQPESEGILTFSTSDAAAVQIAGYESDYLSGFSVRGARGDVVQNAVLTPASVQYGDSLLSGDGAVDEPTGR